MLELSEPLPNRCRPGARATGTKRALKPVQVWGIRIRFQVQQRLRDGHSRSNRKEAQGSLADDEY